MIVPLSPLWKFYKALDLPTPGAYGYWENGSGVSLKKLVFLNRFGLVIAATPRRRVLKKTNPHFLKSLFTWLTPLYQIDIYPGVISAAPDNLHPDTYLEHQAKVKAAVAISEEFAAMLRRDYGIINCDSKAANIGFIPTITPPYPVVIDQDRKHFEFEQPQVERESIQDEFYKPLIETMARAWPKTQEKPDLEGISEFFKIAASFKAQGKLVSSWENVDFFGTRRAGYNYERRMSRYEMARSGAGLPKPVWA